MKKEYWGKEEIDYLYFCQSVTRHLDVLEEWYISMTDPDLIPEMNQDDENDFLENKLFNIAKDLAEEIKKTFVSVTL